MLMTKMIIMIIIRKEKNFSDVILKYATEMYMENRTTYSVIIRLGLIPRFFSSVTCTLFSMQEINLQTKCFYCHCCLWESIYNLFKS